MCRVTIIIEAGVVRIQCAACVTQVIRRQPAQVEYCYDIPLFFSYRTVIFTECATRNPSVGYAINNSADPSQVYTPVNVGDGRLVFCPPGLHVTGTIINPTPSSGGQQAQDSPTTSTVAQNTSGYINQPCLATPYGCMRLPQKRIQTVLRFTTATVASPDDPRARGVDHVVLPDPELSLQDGVSKRHPPRRQQLVERGHVGAARLRDPPLARVLVVELHLQSEEGRTFENNVPPKAGILLLKPRARILWEVENGSCFCCRGRIQNVRSPAHGEKDTLGS